MLRGLLLVSVMLCVSCQQPGTVGRAQPGGSGGPGERHVDEGQYDGPHVTVDVLVQRYLDPVEYIAVIEITAPTGGWEAVLDHAEVVTEEDDEYDDDAARLFVTLQGPGKGETVTQALVPHHLAFRSDERFEVAEVYVRHHRRGRPASEYRLAARQ